MFRRHGNIDRRGRVPNGLKKKAEALPGILKEDPYQDNRTLKNGFVGRLPTGHRRSAPS